jgi:hypothetical protein
MPRWQELVSASARAPRLSCRCTYPRWRRCVAVTNVQAQPATDSPVKEAAAASPAPPPAARISATPLSVSTPLEEIRLSEQRVPRRSAKDVARALVMDKPTSKPTAAAPAPPRRSLPSNNATESSPVVPELPTQFRSPVVAAARAVMDDSDDDEDSLDYGQLAAGQFRARSPVKRSHLASLLKPASPSTPEQALAYDTAAVVVDSEVQPFFGHHSQRPVSTIVPEEL